MLGKALGWEHYKGRMMRQQSRLVLRFGIVHYPWALTIGQHKSKFIMNQTYIDHEAYERGGFLCLLPHSWKVLTPISRHNFPPMLEE